MPVEVLTQIVATISDPSAMLGPEVNKTYSETSHFIVCVLRYRIRKAQPYLCISTISLFMNFNVFVEFKCVIFTT